MIQRKNVAVARAFKFSQSWILESLVIAALIFVVSCPRALAEEAPRAIAQDHDLQAVVQAITAPEPEEAGTTGLLTPDALLDELQSDLNDAIGNENYEEAARLRDEISRLKSSS